MYLNIKFLKNILYFFFSICFTLCYAQKKILVYHETNGFRHTGAINSGVSMFEDLGNQNSDWTTDNSENSNVFTNANLSQYDAVVFLNTSGNGLLSSSEQDAFESFISSGKGFIGIHAATDTYRDKSWPFYNELVGGIVQTGPNHTANNFNADIEVVTNNSITDFLGPIGSTWNKNEEYYYWELNGGQLSTDNTVLLEVESTGNNSYDAARPMAWFKDSITYDDDNNAGTPNVLLSGIKSFYTALGHNGSDYSSDTNFRTLLKNATLWAVENTLTIEDVFKNQNAIKILTNPVKDKVRIYFSNLEAATSISVYNVLGTKVLNKTINTSTLNNNVYDLQMNNYESGVYIFAISNKYTQKTFKIIKI